MLGRVELIVEVDYDKLLTAENVNDLAKFTGSKDVNGIMDAHLKSIVNGLKAILDGHISGGSLGYQISGNVIEKPQIQENIERVEDNENKVEESIEKEVEEIHDEPVPEDEVCTLSTGDEIFSRFKKLQESYNETLTKLGRKNIVNITVSHEFYDLLTEYIEIEQDTYNGIPILKEAMEEDFIIVKHR